MKVFYSNDHWGHAPGWYVADGAVRQCPEVPARVEVIERALREVRGLEMCEAVGVDPMGAIRAVHEAGYLEYLQTIHGVWVAEFGAGNVLPDTFVQRRERMTIPKKPSAQAGFYCFDMAAPITAGTWAAAVGSARCAVSAAQALLNGERGAYALCRPPGHHAGRDYCGGFCYLNNVAIAAEHLRAAGGGGMKRVAILDVDYHHGNGTQDIFYAREDVLFVSIHADPDTQYPYFWGHAEERGAGNGVGFNLNLPLRREASEAAWFSTLDVALERVRAFGAEALLVSLGVDTHERDDVGDFRMTHQGFAEMARRLHTLGVPTAFVQEGGYNLEEIGPAVAAVLSTWTSLDG
jgi:acetoin utilization deacetylase AcuC-like enzyme